MYDTGYKGQKFFNDHLKNPFGNLNPWPCGGWPEND